MMNFQKLLKLKTDKLLLLSFIIIFSGCSKEEKQKDYLAKVNDSYLTWEELASLVDTSDLDASEKNALIKDWIYNEILFQKALEEGITDEDEFNNIVQSSYKKLAIALVIKKIYDETNVNIKTSDLLEYYEKNKNYFVRPYETYLINHAKFKDEITAIKFRDMAIESNWEKAAQFIENNNSAVFIEEGILKELNEIYPVEVADAVKNMFPEELSIVIRDKEMTYNVVQLARKFNAFETFPFEIIKHDVEKRFISEQKAKQFENFLKDLYSKSEIEIKERY